MNKQLAKYMDDLMVGPRLFCRSCRRKKVLSLCHCCQYFKGDKVNELYCRGCGRYICIKKREICRWIYNVANKTTGLDPYNANIYFHRGNNYANQRKYDKAITNYSKAIQLGPWENAYNNRALSYAKLGKHSKAIADYNKIIELDPNYILAYNNRGLSYAEQGEYDKAIADYNKAIKLGPRYTLAYYNLTCTYSLKQNKRKALLHLEKSLQLGYHNFDHMEQDFDLDFIRNTTEYKTLIKRYKND